MEVTNGSRAGWFICSMSPWKDSCDPEAYHQLITFFGQGALLLNAAAGSISAKSASTNVRDPMPVCVRAALAGSQRGVQGLPRCWAHPVRVH